MTFFAIERIDIFFKWQYIRRRRMEIDTGNFVLRIVSPFSSQVPWREEADYF